MMAASLEEDGFYIAQGIVEEGVLEELRRALEGVSGAGTRNVAETIPAVWRVAGCAEIVRLLEALGAAGAFLVRSVYFDKNAEANWNVPWHQDTTIAVRERREVEGFGPWSEKEGVTHVRPAGSVLERMVTLRLHLDDCMAENGALRVLRGSHRAGVMTAEGIQSRRREGEEIVCEVARGGVVAMRPLLLHASSRAERVGHRRVIHLEFATEALPGGLEWHGVRGSGTADGR
jgi:hypothetical protein